MELLNDGYMFLGIFYRVLRIMFVFSYFFLKKKDNKKLHLFHSLSSLSVSHGNLDCTGNDLKFDLYVGAITGTNQTTDPTWMIFLFKKKGETQIPQHGNKQLYAWKIGLLQLNRLLKFKEAALILFHI